MEETNIEWCNACGKAASKTINLKRCSKCRTTLYCSRDCQKKDWKTHKKVCAQYAAAASGSTGPSIQTMPATTTLKNLETQISDPFTRLDNHTYLHDRAGKDVYKLLIDCFRMRQEDDYKFDGDVDIDSVYDGSANSVSGFRKFMKLARSRPGLLPPGWDAVKTKLCESYGMKNANWSNLMTGVEKSDIMEHYGDPRMPMQLRMLAETVYQRGPGGQPGEDTRKLMMSMESGDGPEFSASSLINHAA